MKHKTKILLGLIIGIVLFFAVLAAIYFFAFERFVLVSDPAWSYLLPSSELFSLRATLAVRGYRLVLVKPSASQLDEASAFTPMLLNLNLDKGSVILLGPLASASAIRFEVDVSALLEQAVVYGMSSQACYNFDVTLVSNVKAGWLEAAKAVLKDSGSGSEVGSGSSAGARGKKAQTMAQKVAVVYDFAGTSAFEAINSVIAEDSLAVYFHDGESHLFFSNTVSDMASEQVVLALCPHLENFYELLSLDSSTAWIVDYRYATIVPKSQLFGTVLPDLSGTCAASLGLGKRSENELSAVVELEYKYKNN